MEQTLVIGLEKQKDQPTPSEVPPKLSLSCWRELIKSVGSVTSCSQLLSHKSRGGVGPIMGAHPLEALPAWRSPKKCIQTCGPPSEPSECNPPTHPARPQYPRSCPAEGAGGPGGGACNSMAAPSLWTRAVCFPWPSLCQIECHPGCPWEAPQVEGNGHPWGQSEEGWELPAGTLRGEACNPSSQKGNP